MIDCFIIDDESPAIEVLENYIGRSTELQLVGSATDPIEGIRQINLLKPMLVFLDIEMPELNGVELKELLDKNILTVFCTAYPEYAIKGYELQVADYLVKPIHHKRFLKTEQHLLGQISLRASKEKDETTDNYITVKADHKGKLVKIDFDEIDYIESLSNYLAIYRGKQKILTHHPLRDIENKLPKDRFIRIHKSFIVPVSKISYMEYNEIILKGITRRLPIGNNYKDIVKEKLQDKML